MKNTYMKPSSLILLFLTVVVTPFVFSGNDGKVTLCHKGKNTITVAEPAVRAHLAHGDTYGPCDLSPSLAP